MNNSYKKYLITTNKDKSWGFFINNLGRNVIKKHTLYPSKDHPDQYFFTWDRGRVLNEFHIVLITKGEGVFESNSTGKLKVTDGDVFLLFPEVWHRYRPNKTSGWTERWVGFSGEIANQFLTNGFFNADAPIISKCNKPSVLNYFNTLFKLFDEESYGYQRLASGVCLQLMAELHNIKSAGSNIDQLNSMVSLAKSVMYKNINNTINLKEIATHLGVSYSKFRIDFKKQTGIAPLQYYLLLKIEKSKELLLNTNKSQKEIAFELGFESDVYFNRLFKRKTGLAPGKFRNSTPNF
ncbi:AraC family transcriptional regulator [Hyunsoonleella pacifica]|uniref:AraC family transcriptional regulator n=1 Tax=Hyunsoonleella pacifica TaxID=1080224 RepID=A0A4Q9FS16_9FLAO|nr:AraC family transcriptional regulator [Hyunsoonleella pacifica]TBN18717.1 AraC family transcriptional regulator [Hyunsoonleella pacifica]GGD04133.1 transcriptional regulator [Hyunsoonleella pacifica]